MVCLTIRSLPRRASASVLDSTAPLSVKCKKKRTDTLLGTHIHTETFFFQSQRQVSRAAPTV